MHLLHAVETLSRRAGGLPLAAGELASSLADLDEALSLGIFAGSPSDPIPIPENVQVTRMAPGSYRIGQRIAALHQAHPISVLHQHGLWAPLPVDAGRFARQKKIPLVISPHGMLEPWALNHHALRKKLAWHLYQHRNLKSADVLHATSKTEANHFRELGLTAPIAILSLGLNPPPKSPLDPSAVEAPKERKQLLFLSRIHPKKGIDQLLEAWSKIKAPDWELVIAGNDEGKHQAPLEALARRLNLGDRVRFAGPLYGPDKDTAFRRADLFVLPSHSENFGFVVPEALQYGLPVITTTGTPWDSLPAEDCGWWIEPKLAPLTNALKEATRLSDAEREQMGQNGKALVERDHRWPTLAKRYLEIYRWLGGAGERPDDLWLD